MTAIITNSRNNTYSIAKGIGIILMVVGHSGCPLILRNFIYLFHMPLFYIISGYFFKDKYLNNEFLFIRKRIQGLYIPFVKYSLLFLLFHDVFFKLNIYNEVFYDKNVSYLYSIQDYFEKLKLIFFYFTAKEPLLGAFWFLRSLFISTLLFFSSMWLANKISEKYRLLISAFIVFGIFYCSGWVLKSKNIVLPLNTEKEFIIVSLLYIGYLYHLYFKDKRPNLYIFIATLIFLSISANYYNISIVSSSFGNPLLFLLLSLAGFYMTLYVSTYLNRLANLSTLLVYIGNNTLTILTFHFLMFKIVSLIKIGIYSFDLSYLAKVPVIQEHNSLWWIAYSIVGVFIPLFLSKISQYIGNKINLFTKKLQFIRSIKLALRNITLGKN
jgi:fucose 4-O-acetylase-like acetyltransferase